MDNGRGGAITSTLAQVMASYCSCHLPDFTVAFRVSALELFEGQCVRRQRGKRSIGQKASARRRLGSHELVQNGIVESLDSFVRGCQDLAFYASMQVVRSRKAKFDGSRFVWHSFTHREFVVALFIAHHLCFWQCVISSTLNP